ncbi:MAG: Rab family GTPase [Alphaproteobacteria bacterium]
MKLRKKISILGEIAVGKTSLVRRYVLDSFSEDYHATLGVNIYKREERIAIAGAAATEVTLVVWDIECGDDREALLASYLTGTAGAIIVGDVTRPDTIAAMRDQAANFLSHLPGRPLVFAVNKVDLLPADDGLADTAPLVDEFGCEVLVTSAKEGLKVPALFTGLAGRILEIGA